MSFKIVGKLIPAHEVDYRGDIEDAIEAYVMKALTEMVADWSDHACDDRPSIEFFSSLEGDDAGVEFDMQAFVDCMVNIYETQVRGGDSDLASDAASVWYKFFTESAARLLPFIHKEE